MSYLKDLGPWPKNKKRSGGKSCHFLDPSGVRPRRRSNHRRPRGGRAPEAREEKPRRLAIVPRQESTSRNPSNIQGRIIASSASQLLPRRSWSDSRRKLPSEPQNRTESGPAPSVRWCLLERSSGLDFPGRLVRSPSPRWLPKMQRFVDGVLAVSKEWVGPFASLPTSLCGFSFSWSERCEVLGGWAYVPVGEDPALFVGELIVDSYSWSGFLKNRCFPVGFLVLAECLV